MLDGHTLPGQTQCHAKRLIRKLKWGPEAAEALAKEVGHFNVPGGKDGEVRTLGEYVYRTPKYIMSKVMLEEIAFDTW